MKIYTLSIENEIKVANTNRNEFDKEVKTLLINDLLSSIESLVGHEQDYEALLLQLIDLKNDNIDLLYLARDFDYNFKVISKFK